MEPGKSPLAMLAKTCETIGLSDTPSKKSPHEKKESTSSHTMNAEKMKPKSSPRATPASKEPTLTYPGLLKPPPFPMGMPPMPFPFFNPMMPYQMPFGFPMAPGFMNGARMPCPFAMMRQPCMTPGCVQCNPPTTSASSSSAVPGAFTPEMMAQFAAHPLFSAYAGMMPTVSGASSIPNYQSLLAACASSSAASAASANAAATTPSTSRATPNASKVSPKATSTPAKPAPPATPVSAPKHTCRWTVLDAECGKKFNDEEGLANHVKAVHTPSPPSSASSAASNENSMKTPTSRPTSSASQFRYNPYGKPQPQGPMMTPMGMPNPLMFPFPLQAMYNQRLMSMQHP